MIKYIYILLVLLSLSCESLGTNEFAEELSYYEYVGFGWTHFFDENYNTAIEYFQTAIDVDQVEYTNSANVGKAWTYLIMANETIGTQDMSDRRALADSLFEVSTLFSTEAAELYSECEYTFCCNDCFINDYEVGMIYGNVAKYLDGENDALEYEQLDTLITNFISSHMDTLSNIPLYDFNDGKPYNGSSYLTTNSLIVLLAQIHFLNENIYQACNLLDDGLCANTNGFNSINCLEEDMSYEDIVLILSCLQSYSLP